MGKFALGAWVSRLSKREQLIFFVTAIFIGGLLLDRFVFSSVSSKISGLDEKTNDLEQEIQSSLKILAYEKNILMQRNKYQKAFTSQQTEEEDITLFLKEIENLAKESTIYLLDIKPSVRSEKGMPKQYLVEVNFEAQMEQLLNFLYEITNSEELLRVERYQLRPKEEGSNIVSCNMSIAKMVIVRNK